MLLSHFFQLIIYSTIKIEEHFSFLLSDLLIFARKHKYNFYISRILLLSLISNDILASIAFTIFVFIGVHLANDIYSLMSNSISMGISSAFLVESTSIFSADFIKKIEDHCKTVKFNSNLLRIIDSDTFNIRIRNENKDYIISIPTGLINYYKEDLFILIIRQIYELQSLYWTYSRISIIITKIILSFCYIIIIYKVQTSNSEYKHLEFLNCQILIYFLHFILQLALNFFTKKQEIATDDYLLKLGLKDSLKSILVKMAENTNESNIIHYTSIGAIISKKNSLLKRILRIESKINSSSL